MSTNDIKKGMRFKLACGWHGIMEDNKKGNIRLANVEGIYSEIGSVYSHDIVSVLVNGEWVPVEHNDKQKKCKELNDSLFG